jgi:O-antigen ligase
MQNPNLHDEVLPYFLAAALALAPLYGRNATYQALFALCALLFFLRHPPRFEKNLRLFFAFFAFFGLAALSITYSINRFHTLEGLALLGCCFLGFSLAASLEREKLADAVILAGLFVEIAAILLFVHDSLLYPDPFWGGPFYRTNDLAGFLVIVLPIALSRLVASQKKLLDRSQLLPAGVAGLGIAVWFATWSRAGWFAGAVGLLFWFFLAGRRSLAKILPILLLALTLTLFFSHGHNPLSRIGSLAPANLKRPTENSLVWRANLWQNGKSIALAHPLLGTGYGTFSDALPAYQTQAGYFAHDAHNHFLQLFCELGGFGLFLFLSFLFLLFRKGWQERGNIYVAGFLAAFVASSLHAAFDVDWSVPGILLAFWAAAGGMLPFSAKKRAINKFLLGIMAFLPCYFALSTWAVANGHWGLQNLFFPFDGKAKAAQALQEKDHNKTLSLLAEAQNLNPLDANLLYLEGKWLGKNEPEKARAFFQRAVDLNPYRSPAYYRALAEFSPEEAIPILSLALSRFPAEKLPSYEPYTPSVRPTLLGIALSLQERLLKKGDFAGAAQNEKNISLLLSGTWVPHFAPSLLSPWKTLETFWEAIETGNKEILETILDPPPSPAECERLLSEMRGKRSGAKITIKRVFSEGDQALLEYEIEKESFRGLLVARPDGWHLCYP